VTINDWHVPPETWSAYAAGALAGPDEASVESHVLGCAACRAAATAHAPLDTARLYDDVLATATRPVVPAPLRWLLKVGVPEQELVLLGAADAVALPWVTAVGAALVCALLSGLAGNQLEPVFLALAPLVPVLSVVAAFDATQSLREVSATAPYSTLRLVLLRVTAALVVALPATTAISLLVPNLQALAFSWLLPGLALTTTALVLVTRFAPWLAGTALCMTWASGVAVVSGAGQLEVVVSTAAQAAFAGLTAIMALALVARTTTWSHSDGAA
jgi:hypothetical protein